MKTIRSKGVLTKKDICNEDNDVVNKEPEKEKKTAGLTTKDKHDTASSKDKENNFVEQPKDGGDEIVMLDDNDDRNDNVEVMKDIEDVSADVVEGVIDAIIEDVASQAKSLFDKYSCSLLRKLLKHFCLKMIDGSVGLSEVSGECKLSESETRALLSEITRRCRDSPELEGGKKQSFKVQNIFINSQWVQKIAAFNFQ